MAIKRIAATLHPSGVREAEGTVHLTVLTTSAAAHLCWSEVLQDVIQPNSTHWSERRYLLRVNRLFALFLRRISKQHLTLVQSVMANLSTDAMQPPTSSGLTNISH